MQAAREIRAFLAIEPSAEVLAAIARLQDTLRREISGAISWTRPQGNHLTLKFFGNIDHPAVEKICTAVKKQAATTAPWLLRIAETGVFPDLRKPRVLWTGISGGGLELTKLQNNLEAEFAALGFPEENRPFRAHLTLGRIKEPRAAGIAEALKKHSQFDAGEFPVEELILFQSQLTPQGAIYTKLAAIPLGQQS